MYNLSRIKQIETRFGGKWSYVSFGKWQCTDGRIVKRIEPLIPQSYALFASNKPDAEQLWIFSFNPVTSNQDVKYYVLHEIMMMTTEIISNLIQDGGASVMFNEPALASVAREYKKGFAFGEINPSPLNTRLIKEHRHGSVCLDTVAMMTDNIHLRDKNNLVGDVKFLINQPRGAMLKELHDNSAVTFIPRGYNGWVIPTHYSKVTNQKVAMVDAFTMLSFNAHTSGFRSGRDANGNYIYTPLNIKDLEY